MASSFEISEAEWVEEVAELSKAKDVFVRIQWPFGHVIATVYRPKVNERMLHLLQQQELPLGLHTTFLRVYLPEPEFGFYEKRMNEQSKAVLSMYHLSERDEIVTQTHLTTSLDFLIGEGFDIRLQ